MRLSHLTLVVAMCLITPSVASISVAAKITTIKLLQGNVAINLLKPVIDVFHKEHPNIRVNLVQASWDTVDDKFLAMTVGGQAPDVLMNPSVMGWARYVRQGLFLDLTPFMTSSRKALDLDDFPQGVLNAYKAKGKQHLLPYEVALPHSILYNATLFAEAGLTLPTTDWSSSSWTWDDMVRSGKKLTRLSADGKGEQFGIDFWTGDILPGWSWAGGGDWYDAESYKSGVVNKVILNSPQNLRTYSMVADLAVVHKVRPGVVISKVPSAIDGFKAGKIAMWWYPQSLHNPREYKKTFKWGLAPFPLPDGGNRGGFSWVNGAGILRSSKYPKEAWTFISFLTTRGLTKGFEWPTRTTRTKRWFETLEWWPMDLCANTKSELRTFISGSLKVSKVFPRDIIFPSQAVNNAVVKYLDPAFTGKKDITTALVEAQKAAEIEVKKMVRAK